MYSIGLQFRSSSSDLTTSNFRVSGYYVDSSNFGGIGPPKDLQWKLKITNTTNSNNNPSDQYFFPFASSYADMYNQITPGSQNSSNEYAVRSICCDLIDTTH